MCCWRMSITALGYMETLQTAYMFCGPWCGLFHVMQALANAMLAVVSHEALAAQLRGHPPTFEMLRAFQVPSSIPWRCQFWGSRSCALCDRCGKQFWHMGAAYSSQAGKAPACCARQDAALRSCKGLLPAHQQLAPGIPGYGIVRIATQADNMQ